MRSTHDIMIDWWKASEKEADRREEMYRRGSNPPPPIPSTGDPTLAEKIAVAHREAVAKMNPSLKPEGLTPEASAVYDKMYKRPSMEDICGCGCGQPKRDYRKAVDEAVAKIGIGDLQMGVEKEPAWLPSLVYQMCVRGALIAGSYAKMLYGDDITPGDIDLVIPHDKWSSIALLIPEGATLNKFGGWRFHTEIKTPKPEGKRGLCSTVEEYKTIQLLHPQIEVDVWPDDPLNYLANCKTRHGGKVVLCDFITNRFYSTEFKEI